MKPNCKRLLSFALCLVMLVGLFPADALAESAPAQEPELRGMTDYAVTADGTLGQVFANSLNASDGADGDVSPNHVSTVDVENDTVTVGYSAAEAAELVLAFYADPGEEEDPVLQLLSTAVEEVDPEQTKLSLALPEGLPEYYLIGAYLLRSGSHEPLC